MVQSFQSVYEGLQTLGHEILMQVQAQIVSGRATGVKQ